MSKDLIFTKLCENNKEHASWKVVKKKRWKVINGGWYFTINKDSKTVTTYSNLNNNYIVQDNLSFNRIIIGNFDELYLNGITDKSNYQDVTDQYI